jgi:two-component sensor histidine kinase
LKIFRRSYPLIRKSIGVVIILLLTLHLQTCSDHRYKDFNPEEIVNVPAEQLETYVDTARVFTWLDGYSSERKQLDSLLYFAEALRNYDEDIAQLYAQMAYDIATDHNWRFPRAISAHRLAVFKETKAKYSEEIEDAMVDANISKRIFDQMDREDWKVLIYSLIGRLHYRSNNLDSAQYYLNWALNKIDKVNLSYSKKLTLKANTLHDLANNNLQDKDAFLEYAHLSDSLYQIIGGESDQARLWVDVGQFYITQGKYSEADSLFQESLNYGQQNNDNDALIKAYQGRGYLSSIKYYYSRDEQQSKDALKDFKKCLSLQKEGRYRTYELMGWLHYLRWFNLSLEAESDSVLLYSKMAIEEGSKEGALGTIKTVSQNIVNLCEFEEEWEKCRQILNTTPVAFLNNNLKAAVDTVTYHSKKAYQRTNQVTQREIAVSAEQKRQRQLLIAGGVLVIASLVFLLILQRLQQRRLQARMEALRAQINPHFFSNSLNAIESLVNLDKKREASKYIIHFSRLSRQILNRSREPNTSLKEELSMMKHFLELEKLRFRDKLNFEIIVAEDVEPAQIEVPGLILQPYAENAILHGIKPKAGPGFLRIEVKKEGNRLVCIIEDDGIGREKSRAIKEKLALQRKSLGMDITEERIRTIGKVKGQSLEIIDLVDAEGKASGTKVVLQLPIKFRR